MMKPPRIMRVVNSAGLWILLVCLTGLLTVLFSLLGTITVAVFTAVVMGASRRWQWRTIPVSMAFLLVGLALTHVTKAGLDLRQRISMAGLSFGAFWMTYFLSLGLLSLEKNDHAEPGPTTPAHLPSSQTPEGSNAARVEPIGSGKADASPEAGRITLHDLQGTWISEASDSEAPSQKRLMDIGGGRIVVRILNADGSVQVVAEGKIELDNKGIARPLMLLRDTPRSEK